MTDETRKQLAEYLASRPDVAFAILFGSASRGRETDESDVDLAVYLRDPDGSSRRSAVPEVEQEVFYPQEDEIQIAVEQIVRREVDLVVLNRSPATVAASALTEGDCLCVQSPDLYSGFLLAATKEAEDFRQFLEEFLAVRRRSRSLSDPDRTRLRRIAQYLRDELSDSNLYTEVSVKKYLEEPHFRRAIERWVENLVNASIDIAKIVVASRRLPIPQTYRDTMIALSTVEEFAPFAERLARNTSTRNALAHEYLDMRYKEVARIADQAEELYGGLAEAAEKYASRT